jgi:hypothetical protein
LTLSNKLDLLISGAIAALQQIGRRCALRRLHANDADVSPDDRIGWNVLITCGCLAF